MSVVYRHGRPATDNDIALEQFGIIFCSLERERERGRNLSLNVAMQIEFTLKASNLMEHGKVSLLRWFLRKSHIHLARMAMCDMASIVSIE